MPKAKTGSRVAEKIKHQKRRGVIAPLRGNSTLERKALAEAIRGWPVKREPPKELRIGGRTEIADTEFVGGVRQRDKLSAAGAPYIFKRYAGGVDRRVANPFRFRGEMRRAKSLFKEGVLGTRIIDRAREALRGKKRLRILDIGSGGGQYWGYFLNRFSPEERERIEIHSLNPSNYYARLLEKTGIHAKNQHVGVIETVHFKRLGRFDIVTGFYSLGEKTGTTLYDVLGKIKRLLLPRGACFVLVGHKGLKVEPTESGLRKMLGKRFRLDMFTWNKRTFSHPIVFSRTK
jgi:SAM-dependent methyltransferase